MPVVIIFQFIYKIKTDSDTSFLCNTCNIPSGWLLFRCL